MKVSVFILGLFVVLGVSLGYGQDESCSDLLLTTSLRIKTHFNALKVYKKIEDKTDRYKRGRDEIKRDIKAAKRIFMILELARSEYGASKEMMFPNMEQRLGMVMMELAVKDVEDESSEVVLLCVGRMRLQNGVDHFMLSDTRDDEGDHYWRAWLF